MNAAPDLRRFEGRVALVSGAASGIGRASALRLATEGARVALADLNAEGLAETAFAIGGDPLTLTFDVANPDAWLRAVGQVEDSLGGLHVLVNAAGILMENTVEDTTLDDWWRLLSVNVDGVFYGCRAAVPAIRRAGGGAIVNLSSASGLRGDADLFAYDASKGAVRAFTTELAVELAGDCSQGGDPIRVNAVHPGVIMTPMVKTFFGGRDDMRDAWLAVQPTKSAGTPDDVAGMIAFLASDDASFVTGSSYTIDGGYTA